jgi:hypothetical protein
MTKKFVSPLSFVAVFGSGIRDGKKSGSGIRDKHPGSATLKNSISSKEGKKPWSPSSTPKQKELKKAGCSF